MDDAPPGSAAYVRRYVNTARISISAYDLRLDFGFTETRPKDPASAIAPDQFAIVVAPEFAQRLMFLIADVVTVYDAKRRRSDKRAARREGDPFLRPEPVPGKSEPVSEAAAVVAGTVHDNGDVNWRMRNGDITAPPRTVYPPRYVDAARASVSGFDICLDCDYSLREGFDVRTSAGDVSIVMAADFAWALWGALGDALFAFRVQHGDVRPSVTPQPLAANGWEIREFAFGTVDPSGVARELSGPNAAVSHIRPPRYLSDDELRQRPGPPRPSGPPRPPGPPRPSVRRPLEIDAPKSKTAEADGSES